MKNLLSLCAFLFLASCSLKKTTEVSISNENDFPIEVTVKTNNVSQHFAGIKPNTVFTGIFDWTNIEKTDGQWIFFVRNENTRGVDSFSHGYFTNGELNSFAELKCKGNELKVKISE